MVSSLRTLKSLTFTIASVALIAAPAQGKINYTQNSTELTEKYRTKECQDFKAFINKQTSEIEGLNIDPAKNEELQAHYKKFNTYAIIVSDKDGKVLYEQYKNGATASNKFKMWSVSKAVTTLLVGFYQQLATDKKMRDQLAEKLSSSEKNKIKELVSVYLTQRSNQGRNILDWNILDINPHETFRNKAALISGNKISISQLTKMASGIPWCEYASCSAKDTAKMTYTSARADSVKAYAENIVDTITPGEKFNYSAGNATLIQNALKELTGENYIALTEIFFKALGISDYSFERDGKGVMFGGSGLFLGARSFANLGHLMLNNGRFDGLQLVGRDHIKTMTEINPFLLKSATPDEVKNWEGPTGAGVWLNDPGPHGNVTLPQFMPQIPKTMFYGSGNLGQRLMMFPEHSFTVARIGGENSHSSYWVPFANKAFKCFSGKPLEESKSNVVASASSPNLLKTAAQKAEAAVGVLTNNTPLNLQAMEFCNCAFVTKLGGAKECSQLLPFDVPASIPAAFSDIDLKINKTDQSVVATTRSPLILNYQATARLISDKKACEYKKTKTSKSSIDGMAEQLTPVGRLALEEGLKIIFSLMDEKSSQIDTQSPEQVIAYLHENFMKIFATASMGMSKINNIVGNKQLCLGAVRASQQQVLRNQQNFKPSAELKARQDLYLLALNELSKVCGGDLSKALAQPENMKMFKQYIEVILERLVEMGLLEKVQR